MSSSSTSDTSEFHWSKKQTNIIRQYLSNLGDRSLERHHGKRLLDQDVLLNLIRELNSEGGKHATAKNVMKKIDNLKQAKHANLEQMFAQRRDTTEVDEPLYAHYLTTIHPSAFRPYRDLVLKAQNNDGNAVVKEKTSSTAKASASSAGEAHRVDQDGVGSVDSALSSKQANLVATANAGKSVQQSKDAGKLRTSPVQGWTKLDVAKFVEEAWETEEDRTKAKKYAANMQAQDIDGEGTCE